MARAPDKRIEQAKEMYLQGQKLVEIAKSTKSARGHCPQNGSALTSGMANARINKANVRIEKKVGSQEAKIAPVALLEIKKPRSMDSSAEYLPDETREIFSAIEQADPLDCSGTRSRLLTLLLFERRELPMCEINRTKRLKG